MFERSKILAQAVGFTTLALLALAGALTILSGGSVQAAMQQAGLTAMSTASNAATDLQVVGSVDPGSVPGAFNYQGVVRDANGNLLATDTYSMSFRIYDGVASLNPPLWEEAHSGVTVRDGRFGVTLGYSNTITSTVFAESSDRFVGVTVDGFAEMQPRLRLVSVPYAMHAYNGVPRGGVMHFNLDSCPPEWEPLTDLEGRYIVGLNPGGTLGQQVGTALTDGENRAVGKHSHTATDSGHGHNVTDPKHSHGIDDPGHSHSIDLDDSTGGGGIDDAGNSNDGSDSTGSATTGITINSASTGILIKSGKANISVADAGAVDGTNAPYLQLLACVRQ